MEDPEELRPLTRYEQERLVLALRIAMNKARKLGLKDDPFEGFMYSASIGLYPRKLAQMHNLLKAMAGFDPLGGDPPANVGGDPPANAGEQSQPRGVASTAPPSLQDLRQRIHDKAKAEPELRFRALYVHVAKLETLKEAYKMAKANDGAPGIDGVTFEAIEEGGTDAFLAKLRDELVLRSYTPQRNRKKEIPKGDGKTRTLGIPTIRDRVAQGALKLILEPIFEADFQAGSFGYRPGRSAHDAVNRVAKAIAEGKTQVVDLDLKAYFDNVRHDVLLAKVAQRIEDKDVLHLLKLILKATGKKGVPQGGVISPLLSNLYLTEVDKMLEKAKEVTKEGNRTEVEYARYADDLVVLLGDRPAKAWLNAAVPKRLREEFAKLHVEVNEQKSRVVDLRRDESFGFLGFEFRRVRSRSGRWRPNYTPKAKKRQALLEKLRMEFRSLRSQPIGRVVAKINPILRGWVSYFRIGHASQCFSYIRLYVERKIRTHMMRARGRKGQGWKRWSNVELSRLGVFNDYRIKYYSAPVKALPCPTAP